METLDMLGFEVATLLSGRSEAFDWALRLLIGVDLFKMGVPVLLLLYLWLRPDARTPPQPDFRLRSLLGILVPIAVGRALQDGLPPRLRPIAVLPEGSFTPVDLIRPEASAFPSDHAVLVFAIGTVILTASRPLGLLALGWATFGVCFPRLYFGFHYLSDLAAGAGLGAGLAVLVMRMPLPSVLLSTGRRLAMVMPTLVTLALFLAAYEFLNMFQTTRATLGVARDLMLGLSGGA